MKVGTVSLSSARCRYTTNATTGMKLFETQFRVKLDNYAARSQVSTYLDWYKITVRDLVAQDFKNLVTHYLGEAGLLNALYPVCCPNLLTDKPRSFPGTSLDLKRSTIIGNTNTTKGSFVTTWQKNFQWNPLRIGTTVRKNIWVSQKLSEQCFFWIRSIEPIQRIVYCSKYPFEKQTTVVGRRTTVCSTNQL